MDKKYEIKPFLKWVGGKRQLIPEIEKHIPENIDTYYEPFIGAGAILLHLQPQKAVISDMNKELINCYNVIKNKKDELIKELSKHKNEKDYFYEIRKWDQADNYSQRSDVERAARIIYLNKTCFNGLYRVNKKGYFNTPFGKYSNPTIVDKDNLNNLSLFFNACNLNIYNQDFEKTIKDAKEGDFVYFDPPYDYENEDGFVSYNANGFSRKDLLRLKLFSDKLIKMGCNILISNNDTSFVRETFSGDNYEIIYQFNEVEANRNINSSAKQRSSKVKELLIYGTKK